MQLSQLLRRNFRWRAHPAQARAGGGELLNAENGASDAQLRAPPRRELVFSSRPEGTRPGARTGRVEFNDGEKNGGPAVRRRKHAQVD